MRDIFIGIDGTTPDWYENVRFEKWDMEYSLINMMYVHASAADSDKTFIPGPDLFGKGTTKCVKTALDFLKGLGFGGNKTPRGFDNTRVVLAGYSRGAYAALRVAQALELAGVRVAFGGFLDIVKCTDDATEDAIAGVISDFLGERSAVSALPRPTSQYDTAAQKRAMDALSKDEQRRQQIYAGVNKTWLPNAISWGAGSFSIPNNIASGFHARRNAAVKSHTRPMGHYPTEGNKNVDERNGFWVTHSGMGGMPYRGDLPDTITRVSEWKGSRAVADFVVRHLKAHDLLNTKSPIHPCLRAMDPPASWYQDTHIRSQYALWVEAHKRGDGCGLDAGYEKQIWHDLLAKATAPSYRDRMP